MKHRRVCRALFVNGLMLATAQARDPNFADLLAKAHVEAEAGRYQAPPQDNVVETATAMLNHLGEATPDQLADLDKLLNTALDADHPSDEPAEPLASGKLTQPTLPSVNGPLPVPRSGEISNLIAQADRQIAGGRGYWPLADSAVGSLGLVVTLLPYATPSEVDAFHALPAQFEARADTAEAAGQAGQANDYRHFAAAVSGYLAGPERAGKIVSATPSPGSAAPNLMAPEHMAPELARPAVTAGQSPPRLPEAPPKGVPAASIPKRAVARGSSRPTAQLADQRCRIIVQRMQLGDDLPDEDRLYLRHGCRMG